MFHTANCADLTNRLFSQTLLLKAQENCQQWSSFLNKNDKITLPTYIGKKIEWK